MNINARALDLAAVQEIFTHHLATGKLINDRDMVVIHPWIMQILMGQERSLSIGRLLTPFHPLWTPVTGICTFD